MDTDPQFFKQLSQKARPSKTPNSMPKTKKKKGKKSVRIPKGQKRKKKKRREAAKTENDEEPRDQGVKREKEDKIKRKRKKKGFCPPLDISRTHTSVILVSTALERKKNRM